MRDPAISSAVEDYAKAIYALAGARARCATTALAERLGVTRGVGLRDGQEAGELGLVAHEPYKGVRLTRRGRAARAEGAAPPPAARALPGRDLGVPWDRVHDEAEVLEHVLSEELEELIASKLGNPTRDPHGDPIPTRDLVIDERRPRASPTLEPGDARHVRADLGLRPRDAALARRARDRPRRRLEVIDKQPFGGPLFVRFGRARSTCSAASSPEAMRVEVPGVNPPPPADAAAAALARRRRRAGDGALAAVARARPRSRRSPCSARRSSPRSPTSTRATSPPTSPAAPSTATCCVWVIVTANLMAMLVQYLSAKVGRRHRPEPARALPRALPAAGHAGACGCRPRSIAIATDLAEFVGAAIALNLLFGVPPFAAGLITAVVAFAHPRAADARLPAVRARDRRPARRSCCSASSTTCCSVGVDARRRSRRLGPRVRRHRQRPARRRHPRRDRHAARRLPALRADPEPDRGRATTTSGASCCASSAST